MDYIFFLTITTAHFKQKQKQKNQSEISHILL